MEAFLLWPPIHEGTPLSATVAPRRSGGRSALVVEDDPGVRGMIAGMLEDEGLAVDAAPNGAVALSCAAAHWPDVLVMDMGVPAPGGARLVAALRASFGKVPPIVLVTADGEAARKARQIGAVRHLRKPFDMDDLLGAVRESLATT
ncbi:MAG TPA: response regulator [Chloroflexota bacterium]|nr:response regulator [Chloroflexota bacterium]